MQCFICGYRILTVGDAVAKPINGSDRQIFAHVQCQQQRDMRELPIEELAMSAREQN